VAGGQTQIDFSLIPMLVEVVSVTATKRETAPIDVPFSLVAHSGEDLQGRGAEDIEDVAANVPGVAVQNLGPGQSQVAIRGVSAGQIARDQPGVKEQVGIYLDESPVSLSLFTPDLDLVDVDRVEVLRGPQGTLFGAGSVTGTIRYVTHQPLLGVTEGFVEGGAAAVSDGDGVGNLKAGFNVPMGEKAAARFVGYSTRLAGYTDALQPGFSVDENVNDGYRAGARVAFTIAPNDKLTITPRLAYQEIQANGWNLQDEFNILANPFTTTRPAVEMEQNEEFTQLRENYTDEFALADLNIRYDFGKMALTSITTYIDRDISIIRDTTALTASFTGGNLGFPEPIYTLDSPMYDNTTSSGWTEELRLSGGEDRVQWLAGLFYSHASRDYGQDVTIPGFTAATGIPTQGILAPEDSIYFSDLGYDLDQFAVFGEATFAITDRFGLTAGLRWYDYNEDKTQLVDGAFANPNNGVSVVSLPGETASDGFAPRVIATWKFSADAILNAQVSKGFRLGGINDPLNTALCSPEDLATFGGYDTWDDETVWNYEVGFKSRLLGGRATFNIAAFYIDIDDLQTTVTAGTCSSRLIFNVPKARSQGIEAEFEGTPNPNFYYSFAASYNDSDLESTVTSTDGLGNVTVVSGIEAGRRLPSVPQLMIAASATYLFDVSEVSKIYITGTYQYIGSRYTQVGDQDLGTLDMTTLPNTIGGPLTQSTFTYDPLLPAYNLLNMRVGLRRGTWDIAAYVNNLTNEKALLALERERGTLARVGYLTNQPRTVGIMTRYTF